MRKTSGSRTRRWFLIPFAAFALHAWADETQPDVGESSESQTPAAETPLERASEEDTEEIVVVGERPQEPYVLMDSITLNRIRDDNGKGARLYRQKRYEEAFPYLLSAAKGGFKLSQARVGFIYQMGLGGVPRDAVAAIGWLGVAASGTSAPEIKNYFRKIMKRVPDASLEDFERIVGAYTAEYGSDKTGITCSNTRMAGTHISRIKCDHKDEWRRDILDTQALADGLDSTVGTGGLFGVQDVPQVGSGP